MEDAAGACKPSFAAGNLPNGCVPIQAQLIKIARQR